MHDRGGHREIKMYFFMVKTIKKVGRQDFMHMIARPSINDDTKNWKTRGETHGIYNPFNGQSQFDANYIFCPLINSPRKTPIKKKNIYIHF